MKGLNWKRRGVCSLLQAASAETQNLSVCYQIIKITLRIKRYCVYLYW